MPHARPQPPVQRDVGPASILKPARGGPWARFRAALASLGALTLGLCALAGCRSNPADGEVAFARKFSGPIGVAHEAKNAVVKSQEEWRALWAAGGPGMVAPPVELDWSKSMLIAVALGSRPSGGFSVTIENVTREGSRLLVRAREARPAPDSMQTTMVTAPFDCVELPRFEGRVVFTVE